MKRFCWAGAFMLAGAASASAEPLTLHPLFADHMVLQRERPIAVRGSATTGSTVSVRYGGHEVRTTAATDGRWTALLPALGAFAGDLEVTDSTGGSVRR